jgi:hypothetical protein
VGSRGGTPAFCNVPSGKLRLAKQSRRAWGGGGEGLADGGGGEFSHHEFRQYSTTPSAMQRAGAVWLVGSLTTCSR